MNVKLCAALSYLLVICRPERRAMSFSKSHFSVPDCLRKKKDKEKRKKVLLLMRERLSTWQFVCPLSL